MDKFQQKLNFDFKTNQQIVKLISFTDSFKGKWNLIEKKENIYLKELRRIATIESIGSSTRIEGAKMSDSEVKELLDNIKITNLKTRDEQEVLGYYEVLELIYESFKDIKLTQGHIQHLHSVLLKYSKKDDRHRGRYKNLPNTVVANYPDGTQRIIFNTTAPHLVEPEVNDLINWANEQFILEEIHPLIVIGLFIYEFLSIHPFQDGNGRLSRLLTTCLLLKQDYQFILYVSFESLLEQKKKLYYEALMDGQKDRYSEKERINLWLLFFLQSLEILIQRLEKKYDIFKTRGGYLNDRQKLIKKYIDDNEPVKLADLDIAFPEISINTIKKDLIYLKNEKMINSIGKNRGTIYISIEKKE
ncbi:MAG: Fic family protein [Sphingobacteriales bacterium]|jgi:Fic family protein|nr:Fic family protein [Sphingobacteriales bacterium]MBP9141595.1 Fic family protein [Chitinophagales bacterium]MDA0198459.1 Fic family protein [Bacteroidota bacterium]MBK6890806.1 Fic family protein [Sphingobacteriales bacterium]MBK7526140.1 Fic family protein [Sphingobacteriales bacterium]